MTNMKRALSLLLVVLMTLSLFPLASFAAGGAADEGVSGGTSYDNGVVMKKVYENGLLTLEAYATGSSVTTVVTEPADIVLVLDVSGSMKDEITSYEDIYTEVYNPQTNGTYYYQDSDGAYRQAYYCNRNNRWGKCMGWFTERHTTGVSHDGELLVPKTSAADSDPTHVQFYTYRRNSTTVSKLDALKNAVNAFIDGVAEKSSESRIALVKLAGDNKTEVGDDMYTSGRYRYNYTQTVKTLTKVDAVGQASIKAAVNALRAGGATSADYAMDLAGSIIANTDSKHSKAVVMFTDGEPNHSSGFSSTVAGNAIKASKTIKDAKATVYTVGVFKSTVSDDVHRYMNLVSSNYPNANAWDGSLTDTDPHDYYKTAKDGGELLDIFKSISQEVGGALVELKSETVLKDVVSDYFDLPDGADTIRVHTETCTAIDANGVPTAWENDNNYGAYTAVVSGKTITVTGFDYSANWVGSHNGQPGGKKLVLEIQIVDNGTGFGTVPTNNKESGLYVGDTLVKPFPVPTVEFPYYTVHHVQKGVVVGSTNYRWEENATASLPEKVTSGYLYGGAFKDETCMEPAFANGEALCFTPGKGANYYIWEVGNQYLRAQDYDVWRHVEGAQAGYISVVNLYMLTSIDRLQYQEVGFIVNGASYPAEENGVSEAYGVVDVLQSGVLYDEIYVKNGVINTIHGQSATDKDKGYIACLSLKTIKPDFFQKDGTVTFEPYWVTLDGVKVTGYRTRTSTHLGAGPEDSTTPNYKFVQSKSDDKQPVYTAASTAVTTSMLSFSPVYMINNDADPVAPPVEEGIKVTVVDNGAVYEVAVEAGDITGQITYAGADGMLFAGWYTDEQYTVPADFTNVQQSMTVYARYVSNAYLQVAYKQQEGWFSVSSLTLISAIDGRSYRETGFIINGEKKIVSEYTGGQSGFWFGGFGFGGFGARESAGDYFDGVASDALLMKQYYPVWGLSKGDTLEITPYWVTMDGTTVTGTTRTLTYTGRTITG